MPFFGKTYEITPKYAHINTFLACNPPKKKNFFFLGALNSYLFRASLKLDERSENREWTYARIGEAYSASRSTIAGVAKRFVM